MILPRGTLDAVYNVLRGCGAVNVLRFSRLGHAA